MALFAKSGAKCAMFVAYVRNFTFFLHSPKNAIFRCIVRKSPDLPTDAYLVYVRVENQGFDKTRRQIARF